MKLKLAENLSLPLDFVTERIAFLARTGAGKSGGMRVMFEQFLKAHQFVIFIDPKGDAHGIRAEGIGPGYPVLIMGGDHADIPLTPDGGKVAAEFLVRERVSTVVDISDFGHKEMWRFGADFTRTLYKLNREVAHLFIDEIDMLAGKEFYDPNCLQGIQQIQNKGRSRGWGFTAASQRPQLVNNTVLNASGTYIVMQTIGDDALKVVKRLLGQSCSREVVVEIMSQLPTLQNREAFVYSPQLLGTKPVRITFAEFQTFDSMRTPRPGEARQTPKSLADIDLSKVQRDMAETIEKVKAEDPRELQAEIRRLKLELGKKSDAAPSEPIEIEVPIFPPDIRHGLEDVFSKLEQTGKMFAAAHQFLDAQREKLHAALEKTKDLKASVARPPARTFDRPPPKVSNTSQKPVERAPNLKSHVVSNDGASKYRDALNPKQRAMIDTLLTFEKLGRDSVDRAIVGTFSGMSSKSGTFGVYLGALRNGKEDQFPPLIDYTSSGVTLTDAGRDAAESTIQIDSINDLHNAWKAQIKTPKQILMLELVIDRYPKPVTRSEMANAADMSETSGGFGVYIGALRSLGLIDYMKQGGVSYVVATDLLFPEGLN